MLEGAAVVHCTAQAELATLGRTAASERPATHQHLQPRMRSYAGMFLEPSSGDRTIMFSINVLSVMLLVLVCSNVALLLFARAATREAELVVRTAPGASRGRKVRTPQGAMPCNLASAWIDMGGDAVRRPDGKCHRKQTAPLSLRRTRRQSLLCVLERAG